VWLGLAFDDRDLAFDLIWEMAEPVKSCAAESRLPQGNLLLERLGPLFRLLHMNDWTRPQIIQETASASTEPIVGCGHWQLEWDEFGAGVSQYHDAPEKLESSNPTGHSEWTQRALK
jgi:hypothetical protein